MKTPCVNGPFWGHVVVLASVSRGYVDRSKGTDAARPRRCGPDRCVACTSSAVPVSPLDPPAKPHRVDRRQRIRANEFEHSATVVPHAASLAGAMQKEKSQWFAKRPYQRERLQVGFFDSRSQPWLPAKWARGSSAAKTMCCPGSIPSADARETPALARTAPTG